MTQPRDVLHASKLFQEMLSALKERALLQTHNQSQAMFRSVLLGIRRHMTSEQVLNFADALMPLPRGIFLERWRPRKPEPLDSDADFVREVTDELSPHHVPPPTLVSDVFAVLAQASEPANAETMRKNLPDAIRQLWPNGRD